MIYTLYFNAPFPLYIEFADSLTGQSIVALLIIHKTVMHSIIDISEIFNSFILFNSEANLIHTHGVLLRYFRILLK